MSENEKRPHGQATTAETLQIGVWYKSTDDIIAQSANEKQPNITDFLKCGEENAIRKEVLCRLLHTDIRGLRQRVANERSKGVLILASPGKKGGYFLPASGEQGIEEMLACYRFNRAKAVSFLSALAPIYRELNKHGALESQIDGQMSLEAASCPEEMRL